MTAQAPAPTAATSTAPPTTDDDLVGRLIGGRFRVKSRIGAGGMGAVYVAIDTGNGDKEIALKLIKESLVDSKEAATRFDREAAALKQIEHGNIVQFIGAGVDNGVRFIAMELLTGRTLKERIHSRGSMPWRDTLPIVRGIVCALEAAHSRGLIHRDLKPDNVMLVDDSSSFTGAPAVKLLDFGVAKHTSLPEGQTMTGTGMIVGTPGFVAPEIVLHGSSDDPRSDFYALGATWFEMLTGAKPFDAATPFALAMRHVSETPPRPTDLRPFDPVPLPVEALLFKLLAKTPAERPPNAKALLVALDALADAGTRPNAFDSADTASQKTLTDMRTPQPLIGAGNAPAGSPSTQVIEFPPVQRHSPMSRVLMAGAVVAILVAVVVVIANTRASTSGTGTGTGTGSGTGNTGVPPDVSAVQGRPALPPLAGETNADPPPANEKQKLHGAAPPITDVKSGGEGDTGGGGDSNEKKEANAPPQTQTQTQTQKVTRPPKPAHKPPDAPKPDILSIEAK